MSSFRDMIHIKHGIKVTFNNEKCLYQCYISDDFPYTQVSKYNEALINLLFSYLFQANTLIPTFKSLMINTDIGKSMSGNCKYIQS